MVDCDFGHVIKFLNHSFTLGLIGWKRLKINLIFSRSPLNPSSPKGWFICMNGEGELVIKHRYKFIARTLGAKNILYEVDVLHSPRPHVGDIDCSCSPIVQQLDNPPDDIDRVRWERHRWQIADAIDVSHNRRIDRADKNAAMWHKRHAVRAKLDRGQIVKHWLRKIKRDVLERVQDNSIARSLYHTFNRPAKIRVIVRSSTGARFMPCETPLEFRITSLPAEHEQTYPLTRRRISLARRCAALRSSRGIVKSTRWDR